MEPQVANHAAFLANRSFRTSVVKWVPTLPNNKSDIVGTHIANST